MRSNSTKPRSYRVDAEKNFILVKGAVPGPKGGLITIKESVKASK